jgi:hypothetical protein
MVGYALMHLILITGIRPNFEGVDRPFTDTMMEAHPAEAWVMIACIAMVPSILLVLSGRYMRAGKHRWFSVLVGCLAALFLIIAILAGGLVIWAQRQGTS